MTQETQKRTKYFGNPDELQDVESIKLAAFLSKEAYSNYDLDENSKVPNHDWYVVAKAEHVTENYKDKLEDSTYQKNKSGFDGYLFYNPAKNQFVIAFRGTEFKFSLRGLKDIVADFSHIGRSMNTFDQYMDAERFVTLCLGIINSGKVDINGEIVTFNVSEARQKLIMTGHSLGGALAQLLGAQKAYSGIRVETFNAAGTKEFQRSEFIRKLLRKSKILTETNKPHFDFSENNSNISNHVISRDFVSLVYDSFGKVYVYKPINKYRYKWKDAFLFYLNKAGKGHGIDNFNDSTAFEKSNNILTAQRISRGMRQAGVDSALKYAVATIVSTGVEGADKVLYNDGTEEATKSEAEKSEANIEDAVDKQDDSTNSDNFILHAEIQKTIASPVSYEEFINAEDLDSVSDIDEYLIKEDEDRGELLISDSATSQEPLTQEQFLDRYKDKVTTTYTINRVKREYPPSPLALREQIEDVIYDVLDDFCRYKGFNGQNDY